MSRFYEDQPPDPYPAPDPKREAKLFVLIDGQWLGLQFEDQEERREFEYEIAGRYKGMYEVAMISGYKIRLNPMAISASTRSKRALR